VADPVIILGSLMALAGALALIIHGERKNIVYARLHIAGVIDIACIMMVLWMGYPLVGLAYLVLTPLSAHAIANAHDISEGDGK